MVCLAEGRTMESGVGNWEKSEQKLFRKNPRV